MPDKNLINTLLFFCLSFYLSAQSLTTTTLSGTLYQENLESIANANIELNHASSGIQYQTTTQTNGSFFLPNLRVGGPYILTVNHLGFVTQQINIAKLDLGQNNVLEVHLKKQVLELKEVVVNENTSISKTSFGTETTIAQTTFQLLPNIQRSILDFTRLNPQASLAGFGGKGPRDNFIAIDGSSFNNAYGLGGNIAALVGNVVGAQPLSLDAIEEIRVELSPFKVSQGGFTGAGIHAITKSGSNQFRANLYSFFRNEQLIGKKVDGQTLPLPDFNQNIIGASFSGPLVKNKLFYFINYERERRTSPATNFLANRSGASGNNITRVQASDLEQLSDFLASEYNYQTGAFEQYNHLTNNDKLLIKLDWNLSPKHQFTLRYNQLNAAQETPASNSGSYGAGSRVNNLFSMAYQNSGAIRKVNARSIVGEWHSFIGARSANRLIAGYNYVPDSRAIQGELFPTVDILKEGRTYISFGSHLFATNNSIRQQTFHLQDDFSFYVGNHTLKAGFTFDHSQFDYHFTPAAAGSFVFNSLEDFYNSTVVGTSTPTGMSDGKGKASSYARTYSSLPNQETTEVHPASTQFGIYLQESYQYKQLKVVGGIRMDITNFPQQPMDNPAIAQLTFQNQDGLEESFRTNEPPATIAQFSPRIGFNWKISKKRALQLRGGTGVFTGRSPMVRIGDQYVNNGLLQGQIKAKNNQASKYPFSPDPTAYIPENRTTPATYDLNATVSNFKMPQLWRSALGLDYQLKEGLDLSLDVVYSDEIARDYVRNANLDHQDKGSSADGRFVFNSSKLNNPPILGAYILDNTDAGKQFNTSIQIKKRYDENWMASLAYTYGVAKDVNTFNASSSRTAYRSLPVVGNTNLPVLAFSDDYQQHRIVGMAAYQINYKKIGSTAFSLFLEGAKRGRFSYTYSGKGDINKDGIPNNDLIFVPADVNQIALEAYKQNGQAISVETQWQALDQFLNNSDYLSQRRGQFAERNGSAIPFFFQVDLRIMQAFHVPVVNRQNTIQISFDIINFTNLVNSQWGIQKIPANRTPIEATNKGAFRVNPVLLKEEFLTDTGLLSRWQMQFGLRYIFN